jgi:hypothetical protein
LMESEKTLNVFHFKTTEELLSLPSVLKHTSNGTLNYNIRISPESNNPQIRHLMILDDDGYLWLVVGIVSGSVADLSSLRIATFAPKYREEKPSQKSDFIDSLLKK